MSEFYQKAKLAMGFVVIVVTCHALAVAAIAWPNDPLNADRLGQAGMGNPTSQSELAKVNRQIASSQRYKQELMEEYQALRALSLSGFYELEELDIAFDNVNYSIDEVNQELRELRERKRQLAAGPLDGEMRRLTAENIYVRKLIGEVSEILRVGMDAGTMSREDYEFWISTLQRSHATVDRNERRMVQICRMIRQTMGGRDSGSGAAGED